MVFDSAYFGSANTPIGSYQLTEKEIRAVQAALRSENYAYYAAPWPQGFIDGDSVFLIEPNEISGIVAAGTQNTESVLFLEALDEVMQKGDNL